MPRMEIEDIDLGEVMDIERRRQVRMAEIKHASRSSVQEDDSPFSDENMRHATTKRVQMRKSERKDIHKTLVRELVALHVVACTSAGFLNAGLAELL